MESNAVINGVTLIGKVIGGPVFDHKIYGEAFYMIVLGIYRNSGYEDRIRLIVSERILNGKSPKDGEIIKAEGQIRTYNREIYGKSKLEVIVFVKTLEYKKGDSLYKNDVMFEGYLCKPPNKRTSPLGREICDLMIAVNRRYNKSDYIPAIAWGRNARWSGSLNMGDKVRIGGRIQSRDYRKNTSEGDIITKTAYEVSIVTIDLA